MVPTPGPRALPDGEVADFAGGMLRAVVRRRP